MATSSATLSRRTLIAIIFIPVLTFGAILTIPAFLGVLRDNYGVSHAALGRLASIEYLACILGTYLTNRISVKNLANRIPAACMAASITNIVALLLVSRVSLLWFHFFAAFGAGMCYGYLLKVIDISGQQERYFGTFMALFNITMLGGFQLITLATAHYGGESIFVIYAGLALIAFVIAMCTRKSFANFQSPRSNAVAGRDNSRRPRAAILVSVLAIGISYAAYGMIWPFAQIMGVTRGFSAQHVANGLSAYAITAIFGGLAAAALPQKVDRSVVFGLGLCALLTSLYMMFVGGSYLAFFAGCIIFGFYWNFYLTLQLGVIARGDNTGRGIVLCGVAPSLGVIIGSYLGGALVHGADYSLLAKVGGLLCIIGIACALGAIRAMKSRQQLSPTAPLLS
jgi:predicted MFS family arabinose efflux permease